MADDDNDIRADLRLLVDEGGPAASEEALREVMRRGRRKRRHKRLGAVAATVVAVTGIGVAAATVPAVVGGSGQLRPATAPQRPIPTSTPQATPTPRETTNGYPTTGPTSSSPEVSVSHTRPPPPPELCPDYPNYESADWFDRVPSITVCPVAPGGVELDVPKILRSALPRASVELRYQAGGTWIAQVATAEYVSVVNVNVRRYYGDPAPGDGPAQPEFYIVRPDGSNTPANIARAMPDPVALIYTSGGTLYIVRIQGPDPMPAEQLSAILDALPVARG